MKNKVRLLIFSTMCLNLEQDNSPGNIEIFNKKNTPGNSYKRFYYQIIKPI